MGVGVQKTSKRDRGELDGLRKVGDGLKRGKYNTSNDRENFFLKKIFFEFFFIKKRDFWTKNSEKRGPLCCPLSYRAEWGLKKSQKIYLDWMNKKIFEKIFLQFFFRIFFLKNVFLNQKIRKKGPWPGRFSYRAKRGLKKSEKMYFT